MGIHVNCQNIVIFRVFFFQLSNRRGPADIFKDGIKDVTYIFHIFVLQNGGFMNYVHSGSIFEFPDYVHDRSRNSCLTKIINQTFLLLICRFK